jgi:hypothetical protein
VQLFVSPGFNFIDDIEEVTQVWPAMADVISEPGQNLYYSVTVAYCSGTVA